MQLEDNGLRPKKPKVKESVQCRKCKKDTDITNEMLKSINVSEATKLYCPHCGAVAAKIFPSSHIIS